MKICLDVGHMGKVNKPRDRGAVYEGIAEANLVLLYVTAAAWYLEKEKHLAYILCYNDYDKRHEFCRKINADLHIHCHLNAGKGSYSLIRYKENGAESLAFIMCNNFKKGLKHVTEAKVEKATAKMRGTNCIMESVPSILIEPMFLDNEDHYDFLVWKDGTEKIGKIIAESIIEWRGGEKK